MGLGFSSPSVLRRVDGEWLPDNGDLSQRLAIQGADVAVPPLTGGEQCFGDPEPNQRPDNRPRLYFRPGYLYPVSRATADALNEAGYGKWLSKLDDPPPPRERTHSIPPPFGLAQQAIIDDLSARLARLEATLSAEVGA